jgi:hypothetical protein
VTPPPRAASYTATKAQWEAIIAAWAARLRVTVYPSRCPVEVHFVWYEADRHRDPDGISSGGRKLMLDGLVKAGVLPGDGHAEIMSMTDRFKFDRGPVGVGVHFTCWDGELDRDPTSLDLGIFPYRLPDLNELLALRESSARRSVRRSLRGRLA